MFNVQITQCFRRLHKGLIVKFQRKFTLLIGKEERLSLCLSSQLEDDMVLRK
jgi:hypothetical protein